MTDADYDDWAAQAAEPDPTIRLRELVAELAGLLGFAVYSEPFTPVVVNSAMTVELTCQACRRPAFTGVLRLDPGMTQQVFDTHLCDPAGAAVPFPFSLTVRGTR